MKFEWNLRQLLTAAVIGLLCLGAGYALPHPSAALAQAPTPTPTHFTDDVPGGGKTHGGQALVSEAKVTASAMRIANKSGWACAANSHCLVSFEYRTTPGGGNPPPAFTCPRSTSCFAFSGPGKTGPGFTYEVLDGTTWLPKETVHNVQVTGIVELQSTK